MTPGPRMKLVALGPLVALGACSMAPTYVRPAAPVPRSWPVGDAYLAQSEASLPLVSYAEIFRDPRLQKLIEQALANNRDLRVAAANVAAARAHFTRAVEIRRKVLGDSNPETQASVAALTRVQ